MGVRSYLTVGLLFGLTLPGVSAHGFLGGRGEEEAGQQSHTPLQKNHVSRPQRKRVREREDAARERERVGGVATDAAENRTVETQTDIEERRRLSVGDADPDS